MPWTMKQKLDAQLAKQAEGLKYVEPPKNVDFKIEVAFDSKIEKAAMADPLLRKDFDDAALDTIERFVEFVGLKMKATDQQVTKLVLDNKMAEATTMKTKMNKDIEQMRGSAQQFGVQQVQKAWTDLVAKRKEYTKYKIKIVVTIGAAIAGLATSIALMASAPFTGGASAAISIVGMLKSAVTIAKEVVAAKMEVETAAKLLKGQLDALDVIWTKTKVGGHANEITGTILTQFLGQAGPTIKGCLTEMDRCEKKLIGLEVKNHDLAKTIQKAINKMPDLEEDFMKEVKKRLEKHPSGKGAAEIPKVRQQYHKAVDKAEEAIQEMSKELLSEVDRFKKAKVSVGDLKKRVVVIAKFRGGPYKVLDNALLGVDLLLSPFDGNKLATGAANIAQAVVPAAASFTIDRISKVAFEGTLLE